MRMRLSLAVLLAAVGLAAPAQAQDGTIRIISGFSAGTTADITARVIGAKMAEILKNQVVVENRTGAASSLVWVERPGPAGRLASLDDEEFRAALETRLGGLLGPIGRVSPRTLFPLAGLTATVLGQNRVALLGEAAHVIPPIGAQGLNLGLRDAAALADCVAEARAGGGDIGAPQVLKAYDAARTGDVASRAWTVDLLNRSLITEFLPVHLARGLGLVALKTIGPLRRFLVREGLQPSRAVPSLMRPAGAAGARDKSDVPAH